MASSSPHQTQAIPCPTHQLKLRAGKNILSKKHPSPVIMNVLKVKMLHCSLCKTIFLLQDVSRCRCLGYLTLQEGIYVPDVDPYLDHTYIHTGIMCHSLDYFANVV